MPRSLFVPSVDETEVTLNFPNSDQEPVTVDVLDLDSIYVEASSLGKEMGTTWNAQAPKLIKSRLGITLTVTQATLIYGALQAQIVDVKKKLYEQ